MTLDSWDRRQDLVTLTGKTGTRIVPVSPSTGEALARYVRVRQRQPHASSNALWIGVRGPLGDSGVAQVIDYRCPHRGAQMHLGWVEGDDIRCVYHGWKFDCSGQCLEQPAEEAGFARKGLERQAR